MPCKLAQSPLMQKMHPATAASTEACVGRRHPANSQGNSAIAAGFFRRRENTVIADKDCGLPQLIAVLELTSEQKEAAEKLLAIAGQIDQLEAVIKALPEPKRSALMHYWSEPVLCHGTNVMSYRRTFAALA